MDAPSSLYQRYWQYAQSAAVVVNTATGLILEVNPAAELLCGCGRNELLHTHASLLHPEEQRSLIEAQFIGCQGQSCFLNNIHLITKSGQRIPIEITTSGPFVTDQGTLVVGIFRDVSDQIAHEQLLAAKNWALSAYSTAVMAVGKSSSAEALMNAICDAIVQEPTYVLSWIGMAEDNPDKPIKVQASAGQASAYLDDIEVSWDEHKPNGQGPTAMAIRRQQPVIMTNADNSPEFSFWRERAQKFHIQSSASVPLRINGKRGALMVYANKASAFSDSVVDVFLRLAQQVESGLHTLAQEEQLNEELIRIQKAEFQLKQVLTATIGAMAATMESRDPYTSGHQDRVAQIAVAIGRELGWPEDRLRGLKMASIVHDIGKIGIPTEILTKPSRLSNNEMALMSEHPMIGYNILKDIPFPWPIADIVLQHHERMDGSGYPQGLQGEDILPEARVLSIADIIESMASYRPYRPALGLDVALAEIEQQAGTKLDARIVKIALSLFRDRHFQLPEHHH